MARLHIPLAASPSATTRLGFHFTLSQPPSSWPEA